MLEQLAEASIDGTRKQHIESLVTLPLLIIAAALATLDRLHHGHAAEMRPRTWRTKAGLPAQPAAG
jgi:hypothetical protein